MELTINKEEMIKALAKVQAIIERRSSMPILANVMLEAKEDSLIVNATDLEISLEGQYQAKVHKEGKLTVPARKLYQIAREMPTEEIYLKSKENMQLHISSGKASYNIMCMAADDFPALPVIDSISLLNFDSVILKEMIDKTIFSISQEETRFNLAGLYVQKREMEEKFMLRFVSTDGHRLSLIDREMEGIEAFNLEKGALIPRKGVVEMRRMTDEGGNLDFGLNQTFALLRKESLKLIIRLQEGAFPDYEAVIPKSKGKIINISRMDFNEVLKRVAIMAADTYNGVRLDFKDGLIELSSQNPQIGDSRESFGADYSGEDFSVAFNYSYFMDVCAAMRSDLLNITFIDEQNPCVLRGEGDPGFLSVIMPMRI
ncbi:MAG: DNA polymerase III subunit beta [Desulfarculales bacterium]|jgi:DNA polymerase-3 subunit beta|nr:DNA polymerase III subunit beta [Desulfarculales bacterium]